MKAGEKAKDEDEVIYEGPRGPRIEGREKLQSLPKKGEEEERQQKEVKQAAKSRMPVEKKKPLQRRSVGIKGIAEVRRKKRKKVRSRGQGDLSGLKKKPELSGVGLLPPSEVFSRSGGSAATGLSQNLFSENPKGSAEIETESLGLGRARSPKNGAGGESCGFGMVDVVRWLDCRVDEFLGSLCKTSSTGRLFPLPSSPCVLAHLFPHAPEGPRLMVREWRGLNMLLSFKIRF